MELVKNQIVGKYLLISNPFYKNKIKYCEAKCLWCGKEFTTRLLSIKKGIGCACKKSTRVLLGQRFGKLTVLEIEPNRVKCVCDCGSIKNYIKGNLNSGNTTNCGCEKNKKLIERSTKHNMRKSKIYYIYSHIKSRCYNPKTSSYKWYGAKGIKVCDEWLGENGFINFYNWAISNGYKDGLSIERIDIDKNYCPQNCTWIDVLKQHENTSTTIKIITDDGFCFVKDISKKYNIPKSTIYAKINKLGKHNLTEQRLMQALKGAN
jgi:predicted transcriptional regulator